MLHFGLTLSQPLPRMETRRGDDCVDIFDRKIFYVSSEFTGGNKFALIVVNSIEKYSMFI